MAAHRERRRFAAFLASYGEPDSDFEAAELIFGELVANVARHAPGEIGVWLDWAGDSPRLHVHDRGNGFTWEPRLPADPLEERRRGLHIVATLGAEFRAAPREPRGMCVSVRLPITRTRAAVAM